MGTNPSRKQERDDLSVDTVLDVLSTPAMLIDHQDKSIVQTNEAATRLVGGDYDSLTDYDVSVLFPDASKLSGDETTIKTLVNSLDGEYHQVQVDIRPLQHEDRPCNLLLLEEIGTREQQHWEQQYTDAQFESLLDAMATPVIGVDAIGNIEVWNQAAEQTFGWKRSELLGQPIFSLFDVEDGRINRLYDHLSEGESLVEEQVGIQSKNGEYIQAELYTQPLFVNGEFVGAIGTANDTRDQQCRRQQLDSLHRVLRHNLRTQLNIIEGSTEMLLRDDLSEEQQMTYANQVFEAAEELLQVSKEAHQIRHFAENGTAQAVELSTVIDEIRTFLQEKYPSYPIAVTDALVDAQVSKYTKQILTGLLIYLLENAQMTGASINLATKSEGRSVRIQVCFDEPVDTIPEARSILNDQGDRQLRHEEGLALSRVQVLSTAIGGKISLPDRHKISCRVPRQGL